LHSTHKNLKNKGDIAPRRKWWVVRCPKKEYSRDFEPRQELKNKINEVDPNVVGGGSFEEKVRRGVG
jgi:hypothetical protein